MVKLQHALQNSSDHHLAPLPPIPARIQELEHENIQLHREIESLRRQLEARNARLRPDIAQRGIDTPPLDTRSYDREYRQRGFGCDTDLQSQTVCRHALGSCRGLTRTTQCPTSQLSSPTALSM